MNKKIHWSRRPQQIKRDTDLLRKAGLTFKEDSSGFNRLGNIEIKKKVIALLIEIEFDGADTPEHQQARKIWDENIEELRSV